MEKNSNLSLSINKPIQKHKPQSDKPILKDSEKLNSKKENNHITIEEEDNDKKKEIGTSYLVSKLSKEDLKFAKEIYYVIDKRYSLDEIALVMKHTTQKEEIVDILLNGQDINYFKELESKLEELAEPNIDCPICMDEYTVSEMYTMDCHFSHRICFTCIKTLITMQINSGQLPRCPVLNNSSSSNNNNNNNNSNNNNNNNNANNNNNNNNNNNVNKPNPIANINHNNNNNNNNNNEIDNDIIIIEENNNDNDNDNGNNSNNRNDKYKTCSYFLTESEIQQIFGKGEVWEKYKKLTLTIGLMNVQGCIGCPTAGCENWLEIDQSSKGKFRCDCNACGESFCSLCKEKYHYQTTCEEIHMIKMRWFQWIAQDRGEKEEEINKEAIVKRRLEIERRMKDFLLDEKWKEEHLRLCPSCKNPVEKLGGCDKMVCGNDFHGGNIQRGCGKKFSWHAAKKYKSTYDPHHFEKAALAVKIDKDDKVRLKNDHGEFVRCDKCLNKIYGYRFSCINCPCYNLCEDCEMESTHDSSHYFKIIDKE